MSDFSVQMGRRIYSRRKELGITQEQIALGCRITKSTVSRYEKGQIEHPHRPTVEAIAKMLRVSPEWLYLNTDTPAEDASGRDIRQILTDTRSQLIGQEGLMFDGLPVSQEALQSILDAIEFGIHMADKKQKDING